MSENTKPIGKKGLKEYSSIVLRNRFSQRFQRKGSQFGADDAQRLLIHNENYQHLIHAFYIFGRDPWDKSDEPKILFSYPENDITGSIFPTFCLPDGLNHESSCCDLLSSVYDPQQIENSQFYTLYFPENSDSPFLFCLKFRTNPLTMPSIVHKFTLYELFEKINVRSMPYGDFVVAIKSKLPYHSLFHGFLKWFLTCEMIARMRISDELDNFLSANIIKENEIWPEIHREEILDKIIPFLCRPAPNNLETIKIDQSPYPIFEWTVPDVTKSYYPLAAQCLFNSFVERVSLKSFWKIISAVILERSIIVYHSEEAVVCDAILAFHFLLKPLNWVFSSISILPPSLIDILSAPNPFLIGTVMLIDELENDWVFIDLENGNISTGEKICIHPKLKAFLNDTAKSYSDANAPDSPELINIIEYCNGVINEMANMLYSSIITDFSDPLNVQSKFIEELYLQHFPENEREFMQAFCNTQMVMIFIEQLCRKKSDNMRQAGSMLSP